MTDEDLLTRSLHEVTEQTDYPSTPLATVATRARVVRARRRRTAALAAAAAVAVVVTPGAIWLTRSPGTSPGPSHEASSGPTQSTTTTPFTLSSLPTGKKPTIDYLKGALYVSATGNPATSPAYATADTATPARGGVLTATAVPADRWSGSSRISLVTQGSVRRLGCGYPRFAMSTDGVSSAYWLADSCTPATGGRLYSGSNNTMGQAGPGFVPTPAGEAVEPVGILAQGVVANARRSNATTAEIFLNGSDTATPIAALGTAAGSDENADVVSGQLAADPGVGAVFSASSGHVVWRAEGWTLGQFSTDGKYLLGTQPAKGRPDGYGTYAVFDAATGDRVSTLPRLGADLQVLQVAWDVDDTVLAVSADSTDAEAIVRASTTGHLSLATTVVPADSDQLYRLATRP